MTYLKVTPQMINAIRYLVSSYVVEYSANCTFEDQYLCGYEYTPEGDVFKFIWNSRGTTSGSTSNPTGPSGDHTYRNRSG